MTRRELREHLADSRPFYRRALARAFARDLLQGPTKSTEIVAMGDIPKVAVRLAERIAKQLEELEETEYA